MNGKYKWSYVGYCKCGVVVSAVVDVPEDKEGIANHVKNMIANGLRVEHVPTSEVGQLWGECSCHKTGQATLPGM